MILTSQIFEQSRFYCALHLHASVNVQECEVAKITFAIVNFSSQYWF